MFESRLRTNYPKAVKKASIMIRCTPDEHDAITEAASKARLSKSDFIRQAIADKIKEQEDGNS